MTYNRFVENNLNAWKKVDKDENKLLAIIDKYKLPLIILSIIIVLLIISAIVYHIYFTTNN